MTIRDCLALASLLAGTWVTDAKPLPPPEARPQLIGTVEKVDDGDTFWIDHGDASTKIRVRFADAPEHDQPYGAEAKAFTAKFLGTGNIVCIPHGKSYDRVLADVIVNNGSLGAALVTEGLAWVDTRYTKNKALIASQAQAKAAKKGLWADKAPIAPWDWRKGK